MVRKELLHGALFPTCAILVVLLVLFLPLFWGKIAGNGNALVSLYTPFMFDTYEGYPAGVPSMQGMSDQLKLYIPYLKFTQSQWRQGELPLWNPHNFSGSPHMAEWQSAVAHPLVLIGTFLPIEHAWHLLVISGFGSSILLTYLYLRSLSITPLVSFLGAVSYGVSSVVVRWSQEIVMAPHAAASLPLLMLAFDRFAATKKYRYILLGMSGVGLSLLSGYLQVTLYVCIVSLIYALWRSWAQKLPWTLITGWLTMYVAGFGLVAWQVLPGYELFLESSRRVTDVRQLLESYLLPWQFLVSVLIPDFFGHPATHNEYGFQVGSFYERPLWVGSLPLIGLALWWFHRRHVSGVSWFFLIVGAVTLSFVFDFPLSRLLFVYRIPFFSDALPHRMLFIPAFSWAVLGALGLDRFLQIRSRLVLLKTSLLILTVFAGILVAVLLVRWVRFDIAEWPQASEWSTVALRNSVLPFTFTLSMLATLFVRKRIGLFVLCVLVIGQLWYGFAKFTVFSPKEFFYPDHPMFTWVKHNAGIERVWGYGDAFLPNNIATYYGLYTVEGYDSLHSNRYAQLLSSMQTGNLDQPLSRSDAGLQRAPDGLYAVNTHPRRLRLMSMLNVRYFLDKAGEIKTSPFNEEPRFQSREFELAWTDGKWRIFAFKDAYPRTYLASRYMVKESDQAILDTLYNPEFSPKDTLVLEQEIPEALKPDPNSFGTAEITSYRSNIVSIHTTSKGRQLLFLADSYFPGWNAYVDGTPVPLWRANFAFRAAPVPEGAHTVELIYEPKSFKVGLIIAFTTLISITAVSFVETARRDLR